jgi:hypothetical protein
MDIYFQITWQHSRISLFFPNIQYDNNLKIKEPERSLVRRKNLRCKLWSPIVIRWLKGIFDLSLWLQWAGPSTLGPWRGCQSAGTDPSWGRYSTHTLTPEGYSSQGSSQSQVYSTHTLTAEGYSSQGSSQTQVYTTQYYHSWGLH